MKMLLISSFLFIGGQTIVSAESRSETTATIKVLENDPATVIAKYIKAVGGAEKVASIKNASMTGEADFQGQKILIKTISDSENSRLMQSTSVGGNVVQKTLLVDGKAKIIMMGQTQEVPEETAALLRPQTHVFPEQNYAEMGYEMAYIGTEDIDGEETHKLEITAPNGMKTAEYYSVESGLKVRTSSEATGDISYSDYQEVDGILFPMMLTITNAMLPMPMEAKIVSVKFNTELSDTDFQ